VPADEVTTFTTSLEVHSVSKALSEASLVSAKWSKIRSSLIPGLRNKRESRLPSKSSSVLGTTFCTRIVGSVCEVALPLATMLL